MKQRPRQFEGRGIALQCQLGQVRPTGVRQTHQLGRLVKGFTRRVVNAFAQQLIAAYAVHPHQLRVATRDQQSHKRKLRRIGT